MRTAKQSYCILARCDSTTSRLGSLVRMVGWPSWPLGPSRGPWETASRTFFPLGPVKGPLGLGSFWKRFRGVPYRASPGARMAIPTVLASEPSLTSSIWSIPPEAPKALQASERSAHLRFWRALSSDPGLSPGGGTLTRFTCRSTRWRATNTTRHAQAALERRRRQ